MNAIKSIIVSFLRTVRRTSYAEYVNWPDISKTFIESLKYHTETIEISSLVNQRLMVNLDKDQILIEHKINAIKILAEQIINKGYYELTEEIEYDCFKNTYRVHILIDRGLR